MTDQMREALREARSCLCSFTGGPDGACSETISRIDAALSALREQRPVAWQFWTGECWILCEPPDARELRDDPEKFRPLYISAPPAPGWDEAVSTACNICSEAANEADGNASRAAMAEELTASIKALRREAPASSGVEGAGIDAAAEYLVRTVKRTLWDSLRKDGRARDGGFEPFPHNPRQEDYRDVVREIVRVAAPSCSGAGGGVRETLADWSDLPKDIYVIGAQRVNAVGYDVQCCSVPMVTVPEIRYVRADIAVNASAELEDARAESADSLRVLDAIAEYVGCPHDEELTVDHVRQHYMKLENAAQRQGIEDAGRIANAQAYASAEARLREALDSLAHAEEMLSKHIEEYHDFDYEPHQVPQELAQLRGIQHHLLGSLTGEDGNAIAKPADAGNASAEARLRELEPWLAAADRMADGITAFLGDPDWQPSRAYIKQPRNVIRNMVRDVRKALSAGGDEAKKSEGGVKFVEGYFTDQYAAGERPPVGPSDRTAESSAQYRKAVDDANRMNDKGEAPSDPTAGVTVEDIAEIISTAPIVTPSETTGAEQIARALLDAFTVGRR